ncbi:uncharacterized protein BT62DRAFT_1003143 [Guyanagaster necrorhizus]|uniref:Uncharacterized protein n=1 Tax=Guyanagaster necrorhizus TaxID=856835 RepID=A0A9P7VWY0_9AGAR|nr:uncharacterized protein BT62DRAFT_1003143 [Guyanagaster necrorhizus MCA 3950]KAG7448427.1 hypothetical protein BT62DRAFT_1003143 [Guyanagaster necrorhizus MCA 3950]
MNKMREMQEKAEEEAKKSLKRPPTNRCTGCNHKFHDEDDEEVRELVRAASPTHSMACTALATVKVPTSGFRTAWYHMSSAPRGTVYRGDRHPPAADGDPDVYEDKPRKCGSCGEISLCLKKEFL